MNLNEKTTFDIETRHMWLPLDSDKSGEDHLVHFVYLTVETENEQLLYTLFWDEVTDEINLVVQERKAMKQLVIKSAWSNTYGKNIIGALQLMDFLLYDVLLWNFEEEGISSRVINDNDETGSYGPFGPESLFIITTIPGTLDKMYTADKVDLNMVPSTYFIVGDPQ